MMDMVLLMVAAMAPAPAPSLAVAAKPLGNPAFWVQPADYPADALRQMMEGTTTFRVTVDGAGAVAKCEIVESSGSPSLDAQTCTLVARRARFSPAKDVSGSPVEGTYQNRIRWRIPAGPPGPPAPPNALTLPAGPKGNWIALHRPLIKADDPQHVALVQGGTVAYTLDIDSTGKVTACSVTSPTTAIAVADTTCRHLTSVTMTPARDIDDQPTPSRYKGELAWREAGPTVNAMPPAINRFEPGQAQIGFTLGADGMIANCKVSVTGANPFGAASDGPCNNRRRTEPFRDAQGQPVARDVTVTIAVDVKDAVGPASPGSSGE